MSKRKKKRAARPSARLMNPLTWHRAATIPDQRKKASREACRRRIADER